MGGIERPSAAKAGIENMAVIAAVKPLRHPKARAKSSFSVVPQFEFQTEALPVFRDLASAYF